MARYLVDGMNVIGSRPDGWWRDRARAVRNLASRLEAWSAATGVDVTVVVDGRPVDDLAVQSGKVVFSRYADDEIARMVIADDDPSSLTVVTSDRPLAGRVRAAGASVMGSGAFLRTLENAG